MKNVKYWIWGSVAAIAALGALTPVRAAEPYITAGKTTPSAGSEVVGVASIGARFTRYGVEATYIAETPIYDSEVMTPSILMLTGYRYWQGPNKWYLLGGRPEGIVGISIKSANRCKHDGETDCDRRMPLPVAFHFGIGVEWQDFRLDLYHDSNNALDHGPEKKNLGVNWLALTYRF